MISARIIADSINPSGKRLTSWILKYPRFIHAEFMTHRIFSRNAASSRAIPFAKMVEDIKQQPALPEFWSSEHKGMTAVESLDGEDLLAVRHEWKNAAHRAIDAAKIVSNMGLAKSLCNRLLEPFSHITVLATATDHRNFFALRAHPAAMPEFQVLAYRMLDAYLKSEPNELPWGHWHIPHFDNEPDYSNDGIACGDGTMQKVATARCARLSYLTFDGEYSLEQDIALHDRLLASGHMSPFEHCAQAVERQKSVSNFDNMTRDLAAPNWDEWDGFSGWEQYRKQFPDENRTEVHLGDILETKPEWIKL